MITLKKYIFQTSFLLCLGIFIFLFFYHPIETEDVWWHLSTGRWIAQHVQVPNEDVFPFAHERTHWLCNNEWLGSVILYLIAKGGGVVGLKVFRPLFFIFLTGILFFYSYKRLPFSLLILLILLETFGLANRSFLRPDIFNFFFIQIFLINLFDYEDSGKRQRLWILPILSCIWFNIHLGSFIYGTLLLFIFFLSACVRYFNLNLGRGDASQKVNAKRQVQDLALTALACLVSFAVNPYGIEGFLYPFKVFLFPDFVGYHKLTTLIVEMQPPGYLFTSFHYFYYFALFAFGLFIIPFNKKNNFSLTMLLMFSFFVFLYMQRASSFFTLVCAYVIVEGAKRTRFNDIWKSFRYSKLVDGLLLTGIAIFLLIQILTFWDQKSYFNGRRINDRSLTVNLLSEAPIQLLLKNKITGPVFNQDLLGGQIIWLGYPDLRPFLDGRNSSQERLNITQAIFLNPQGIWPKAESDYHFKIIILHLSQFPFIKYISTLPTWQLISVSGDYVTYVKRGAFHLPKELNGFEDTLRSRVVSTEDLRSLKRLTERKNVSMLRGILHPSAYVDLISDSITLFELGYKGAAVEDLVKASKISDHPYIRNLAVVMLKQLDKTS
jgi:hypothetical protein